MPKRKGAALVPILILMLMSIPSACIISSSDGISSAPQIDIIPESSLPCLNAVQDSDIGAGLLSDITPIEPAREPNSPKTLVATAGNAQVILTWSPPPHDGGANITNYSVYRGTSPSMEVLLVTLGVVLTYTDLSVTNGVTYYYQVSAINSEGESQRSNEASVIPATVPSAPQNLVASPGNGLVNLTWAQPSSNGGRPITNYTIYRGTTSGGESFLLTVGNVLAYSDAGLVNGQRYYYQVTAVNGVGEGGRSNEASAVPATVPSAPQSLIATPGNAQITLTWTAPSSDHGSPITNYKIYRGIAPGAETFFINAGNVLIYLDQGLTTGQIYYYKVSAVNGMGEGAQSNEASATPTAVPSAPQDLVATRGNGHISLTWNAPLNDGGSPITSYKIYRGTTSGGETLLTNVGNVYFHDDAGLTNGQTYYYKVSAVTANGEGALSNEASATPATLPSAPQSLAALGGASRVDLSWTAPLSDGGSLVTNYNVYRGGSSDGEVLLVTVGNVLSFADMGLTNGQTYYYKVSAVNSVGEGALSNEDSATPASVPGSPNLISTAPGMNLIALAWAAPASDGGSAITGYQVFRGTASGGETLLITLGNVLIYTDTGLVNGQTYFYRMAAVNAIGAGPLSNELNAKPVGPPTAPQNPQAIPGNAFVNITWASPANDGGSTITNYQVWRGSSSGGETLLANVGLRLWLNDTGLNNGQTYFYIVIAENVYGSGPSSNEVSATPSQTNTVPSAPRSLVAAAGNSQVVLNWTAPATDGGASISAYRVYRGTSSGGEGLLITLGNVLTYTNTGLTNGQIYYYRVSAINSVGEGAQSNEASATPIAPNSVPSAPQSLSASPGNAQIVLTWSAPASNGGASITAYKVYRSTSSGGETLLTTLGNVLTYTNTGLTNGQIYYYRVSAVNSVGEGAQSNDASATPRTVPTSPQSLTAVPGNSQVTLSWAAPSSNGGSAITNHYIYRGTASGGETLLTTIGSALTFTDTGLTNGQRYYYKVSAVNAAGEGAQSNEASATPITVPSAPTLISATPGSSQVVLTWTAPSSNGGAAITGYSIYRELASGGTTLISVGNVLTYVDTGLANGQTYRYQVAAVSSVGEGARSNQLDAVPIGTPSAPLNLQASPGDAFINLSWLAPSSDGGSSITNYQVWRGASSGAEVFLADAGLRLWFNDTGLTNGLTYFYTIKAESLQGLGPSSNEAFSTPSQTSTAPSAPQGLSATAGDAQVFLSWSPPANDGGSQVTGYRIYRGNASGGEMLLASTWDVLNFTDIGLANGQTYYYMVSAVNGAGEGARSNEAWAVPATLPSAPQQLAATPGDSQVALTWAAPASDGGSSITSYEVYRGSSSGGEVFLASVVDVSYSDQGLTNGQTYYYAVAAVNSIGKGPLSVEIAVTPLALPSAPGNLTASPSNAEIVLAWTPPSNDGGSPIINYSLYRGTAPGTESLLVVLGDVLSYVDAGLVNGQTYYYQVGAVTTVGEGLRSNEASATPAAVPSAPQNLTAAAHDGAIYLSWLPPSNDGGKSVTNYTIYRSETSGEGTLLATIGSALNYSDMGLSNGHTYYYAVAAVNSEGEGARSSEVSATPASTPSAPQDLVAVVENQQIALSWKAPSSDGGSTITNYTVYRGTSSGGETLLVTIGNVLGFIDTGLTNGQAYYYLVSAVNPIGEGALSNEANGTPANVPSAPLDLVATSGISEIVLTWMAPTNDGGSPILYYCIYRGTSSGGESYLTTVADGLTYTDPGAPGQTFFYLISAVSAIGEGSRSNEASATVVSVPSAPRGLQALPNNQAVSLNWTAPSYPGVGSLTYFLYRDGMEIWNGTSLNYWDAPLTKGQQHSYKVAAKSHIGMGPNCSEVFVIPHGVPDVPWGLEVVPGNERMSLSWKGVNYTGPGTLVYHVFRDEALIWSGPAASCLDTVVVNGVRYEYKVAASNDVGWSENSSAVIGIPLGPPTAPLGLLAQPRVGSIQLNWSAPVYSGPGTTTYHLYRDGALIWSGEGLGYMDTGLDTAMAHSYTVAADNSIGKGPNSTAAEATPLSTGGEALPMQAIAVVGFLSIAAIPIGFLAMQAYRHRYILAVSIMSSMRCPNCGTVIPVGTTKCSSCGVKISWRKIDKEGSKPESPKL